ncbi:P1 family peptidase [Bacillus sp. PS06]|uniref:DmpA family aminopeptidase n=1 Tax=Bacillus sp. PS06 TaxID=2764176 RepID=UPI00178150D0|nr:P1 family peptidase [Bacillus sp. PS06]MBD8068052.1 P1 family peptidase [Bacillus sp. PS06]
MKRLRDYGVTIGSLKPGPKNKITDVKGVTVGHSTISDGSYKTGVTSIIPHGGNVFREKVIASSYVLNGFGKTVGTIQIEELGTIETPILLTNTLSVPTCSSALLKYMLNQNDDIGTTTGTINTVVGECNDMYLNDIRDFAVKEEHAFIALEQASVDFDEGNIGAGTGMKCFGLKGGIGSSSREITYYHGTYTIGVLALTNFGQLQHLTIDGHKVGPRIKQLIPSTQEEMDKGSVIIVIATDLPVSDRQLHRILKRASVGLSRTGSYIGHGSGDIFIGFSTANKISHYSNEQLQHFAFIHEEEIEQAFIGVADATEEAILNSLLTSKTTIGRDQHKLISLSEFIEEIL